MLSDAISDYVRVLVLHAITALTKPRVCAQLVSATLRVSISVPTFLLNTQPCLPILAKKLRVTLSVSVPRVTVNSLSNNNCGTVGSSRVALN